MNGNPAKLTELQLAIVDWLEEELEEVPESRWGEKLIGLAPQVNLTAEGAERLLRRARHHRKYEARHFAVPESTYDPQVLSELAGSGPEPEAVEEAAKAEPAPQQSKAGELAGACGVVLGYLKRALLRKRVVRKYWRARLLQPDEQCECREGAGSVLLANGREEQWLIRAVLILDRDGNVKEAFPDAWVRRRLKRKQGCALQLERLALLDGIDFEELGRRVAAMLRLYYGAASGLHSQEQLAALGGVSKQAVSDMERRMAAFYRERTGGRAGFEGVKGKAPKKRSRKRAA